MRFIKEGFLKGIGFLLGIGLVTALTALAAQTFRTFQSGDVISAALINDTFQYLKSRVENPLPRTESTGAAGWRTTSTAWTDVPNLSVTVTSGGSPVWLGLVSAGSGSSCSLGTEHNTGAIAFGWIRLQRAGSEIARHHLAVRADGASHVYVETPGGAVWFIDAPGAGTYTYQIQARAEPSVAGSSMGFGDCKLIAARFNET